MRGGVCGSSASDPHDGHVQADRRPRLDKRSVLDEILIRQLEAELVIDAGQVGGFCGLREGDARHRRQVLKRGRTEGLRVQTDSKDPDMRTQRKLSDLVKSERAASVGSV